MIKNVKISCYLAIFIMASAFCNAQNQYTANPLLAKDILSQKGWIDSVYKKLSWKQRIGQLFMVAAYSNGTAKNQHQIEELIRDYHVGGIIFMQGEPTKQVQLTNLYQSSAKVPLLIGQDCEWGLAMRLDSTLRYPFQLTLGAVRNDSLLYEMGADIARQMKIMGVHLNFAPVVDINSNPDNPVIGFRSFGENPQNVARKAKQYMLGLQDNGVLACAKHFPGHGDTASDSHHTLPTVSKSLDELHSSELLPFDTLIKSGVATIMNAHLAVPAIDNSFSPASISKKVNQQLLQNQMNFEGLVITDALNMKGVSEYLPPGKLEITAINAGNDVLLFSQNIPLAIKSIRKAMRKRKIKRKHIEAKVKKILATKYKVGLGKFEPINTDNLLAKLHQPYSHSLIDNLYRNSITIAQNKEKLLPFIYPDTTSYASISFNSTAPTFHKMLQKYAPVTTFNLDKGEIPPKLMDKLSAYEVVFVGLFGLNNYPKNNYGLQQSDVEFINALSKKTSVVLSVFGNPYLLSSFAPIDYLVCAYQDNEYTQSIVPQILFGAENANGKLPISAGSSTSEGRGEVVEGINRLGYTIPEAVGMESNVLSKIDLIAQEAISTKATPGCQVLVARHGKVVLEKAYGYHTYDSLRPVTSRTIYDIASITKVAATLQAVMHMEEKGLIDLDKKISFYLTDLKGTNKEHATIRDILTHQAGLWPYLPFWRNTISNGKYLSKYYHNQVNMNFPFTVSDSLYSSKNIQQTIWEWVKESKMREKKEDEPYSYKYSDMGYYMMQRLVALILNQPMEDFLKQQLYAPLGLQYLGYKPLDRFPKSQITPTENDINFRQSQIHGTVHDEGAALVGGVAGHAGLFSNAHDLATLMQMHLQNGQYGGHQYLTKTTLDKFTAQQYLHYNRRGVGWDKPLQGAWYGPTSELASPATYGHTGFTGTAVWVDPKFDLVVVFLSNRIYPEASNKKLIRNNIRTRIQDLVYQSIFEYDKYH